jgi:hypothetical protein
MQSFSVKSHLDVRLILFVLGIKYAWNIFFLVRFAEQIKETFSSLTVLLDLLQFSNHHLPLPGCCLARQTVMSRHLQSLFYSCQ